MSTFILQKHLSRRSLLRGAGITLGLPLLEAMTPAFAKGQEARQAKSAAQIWIRDPNNLATYIKLVQAATRRLIA